MVYYVVCESQPDYKKYSPDSCDHRRNDSCNADGSILIFETATVSNDTFTKVKYVVA